jgi:glucose/arabinose dehydrogenase
MRRRGDLLFRAVGLLAWPLAGCGGTTSSGADASVDGGPPADATADVVPAGEGGAVQPGDASTETGPTDGATDGPIIIPAGDASISALCSLAGSIQYTNAGTSVVPGGSLAAPDLSYLKLPAGFCVHYFGNVANARQLRFAPGGELFVASPSTPTAGGGLGGQSAIVVLPDDDNDGYADTPVTFLAGLPSTQGLLFTSGSLYYQDGTAIKLLPYALGQRTAAGTPKVAADVTVYRSTIHWPKALDVADDGTIYVTNGGDQNEQCDPSRPFHGGILKIDGSPGGAPVARGLRNPIALRCASGHNLCFALELAMDLGAGSREKLLPVRQGDDWGFPCCAGKNLPYYTGVTPPPDCSGTAAEIDGFLTGDTPFGIDFERGKWPAPYRYSAFVTLHGSFGTWTGERLVAIAWDTNSGMPLPGNDLNNVDTGGMGDFVTGWDNASNAHGRPSAVTFSSDGRLFVANDNNGDIFWIASMTQ